MIASLILAVIVIAVGEMVTRSQNVYESVADDAFLRQGGRTAASRMTDEMRLAGYNLENVPEAVWAASPTELSFAADLDNGDTDLPCVNEVGPTQGVERISYRFNNGVIERRVECWSAGGWVLEIDYTALATMVDGSVPLFRYFDVDGTEIAAGATLSMSQRADIAIVQLQFDLVDTAMSHLDSGDDVHASYSFDEQILLRNRVLNSS